jgi:multidrug transporter EmrE-like cation transporter
MGLLDNRYLLAIYCLLAASAVFLLRVVVSRASSNSSRELSLIDRLNHVGIFTLAACGCIYILSFIFWIMVVKFVPLSIAIPVQLSVLTIVGIFLDYSFSGKALDARSIWGISMVLIGVLVMSTSKLLQK